MPIALIVLLALLTGYSAFNHIAALRLSQQQVNHAHKVMETTQGLFSHIQDAETGQRGYLLTGQREYLTPWRKAVAAIPGELSRLRALVADSPDQMERVGQLEAALALRLDVLQQTVEAMDRGDTNEAHSLVRSGRGKVLMERLRTVNAEILREEQRLLTIRQAQAEADERRGLALTLGVGGLALVGLVLAVLALARVNRDMAQALGERDAADAARRESDALVRAVFENIPDYLYTFDITPDRRFLVGDFNPALAKLLGDEVESYRGREVLEVFPVLGPRLLATYERVLAAGRALVMRDAMELPGGERVSWESILAPVYDAAGRPTRIVGSSRDISERERAEEQARRSQRMEAVGQLTGGVAHDFNNLLQVIRANLEMVERSLTDAKLRGRLQNALHASDRAADLTRQLLAFARRQPLEPQVVNLGRLVGEMAELLRRTLGESIEVETVLSGGLWNTVADPTQVESALLNLAINARDAMDGGGRLTVELANAALDDGYAARNHDVAPGQYVMLAVSDTGTGMSREVLARVFEPFFTTKGEGRGTGLGLSMVYGFVKQSKGHIQIYSEPGQGTTVKIYLPRTRKAEPAAPAIERLDEGRGEIVLVVEDEEAVREAACAMLVELGYGCLQAEGPASALVLLNGEARIDLLFTDVVMPGDMKTPAFVAEAQRLRPGLPVVYTSGYTENAIVHHGRLDEGVALLSKPYAKADLARKIAAGLRTGRSVVLIVEDEALVRTAAVEMATELGFGVLEAADAGEALAFLESDARIDVLLSDVGLPGMKGDELIRRAAAMRPGLRLVVASGYSSDPVTAPSDGVLALDKPYDVAALARALGV